MVNTWVSSPPLLWDSSILDWWTLLLVSPLNFPCRLYQYFYNFLWSGSPQFLFIQICFICSNKEIVNQIVNKSKSKHWIIETSSFLIGTFIFILNNEWMGRNNCMSMLLKESSIKVLLKENRISDIVNVPGLLWFNWFKHLITFFMLL